MTFKYDITIKRWYHFWIFWKPTNLFFADESSHLNLPCGVQFLSMLESLFEKEAKRMEIDMKADTLWIAIVPKFRLLYGTWAMGITISLEIATVGLSMIRLLKLQTEFLQVIPISWLFLPPKAVCQAPQYHPLYKHHCRCQIQMLVIIWYLTQSISF